MRCVLIGSNIAHSRSPRLHNHLFERYGLPHRYELMPLEAEHVVDAITTMKRGDFLGANVTSPHKEIVLDAMDDLYDEARRAGAVNTILFANGCAAGHNTDVAGVRATLAGDELVDAPFSAAILGTGGAARAAAVALAELETLTRLTFISRSTERAAEVADAFGDSRFSGASFADFPSSDLVINATPLGLPGSGAMSLDASRLAGTRLLFDMVYSSPETQLMMEARSAGARGVNGRTMFIGQALAAFTIWTGIAATANDLPADLFGNDR